MSKDEIDQILSEIAVKRIEPLDTLTEQDWQVLEDKFQCSFDLDFVNFMDILGSYQFPGEVYDVVRSGRTSGNGTIDAIYDIEMSFGSESGWNADLIPFYGIGNGDCFCLSASRCQNSPVFYVYHEDGHFQEEYPSVEAFLRDLPELLSTNNM